MLPVAPPAKALPLAGSAAPAKALLCGAAAPSTTGAAPAIGVGAAGAVPTTPGKALLAPVKSKGLSLSYFWYASRVIRAERRSRQRAFLNIIRKALQVILTKPPIYGSIAWQLP